MTTDGDYPPESNVAIALATLLANNGGAMTTSETYKPLAKIMGLSDSLRKEQMGDGRRKWDNVVQWARNNLRKADWLDDSPPGVWKLNAKGLAKFTELDRSAINDLENNDYGNDDPEYLRRISGTYIRDPKVRNEVLDRAKGECEYCGERGFIDVKGLPFLEAHHVISLSDQGPDKLTNVIALCPNDHRRAHFGQDWNQLQDQFLAILEKKN